MSLTPRSRVLVGAFLVGAVFVLAPIINVSLPDPLFLNGVFDGGDWDDVLQFVLSLDGSLEAAPALADVHPLSLHHLWPSEVVRPAAILARTFRGRAPPNA